MPVGVTDVSDQYDDAIAALREIHEDYTLNAAQRGAAGAAIKDLYIQLGSQAIQRVEGRTALLSALIAELTAVSDSIQLNPVGEVLDKLNACIEQGRTLYEESKKELTP